MQVFLFPFSCLAYWMPTFFCLRSNFKKDSISPLPFCIVAKVSNRKKKWIWPSLSRNTGKIEYFCGTCAIRRQRERFWIFNGACFQIWCVYLDILRSKIILLWLGFQVNVAYLVLFFQIPLKAEKRQVISDYTIFDSVINWRLYPVCSLAASGYFGARLYSYRFKRKQSYMFYGLKKWLEPARAHPEKISFLYRVRSHRSKFVKA